MAWLTLVRWQNLLIVFLTQLLAWVCVILPIQQHAGSLVLDLPGFIALSLSTILIAAAGYIINDYFDIKIDVINRPEKVVLEKQIPLKHAIIMHTVLNVIGIALALYVARRAGHMWWVMFQVCCTIMLWLYSTTLKRKFMSGNVVVALLTAFTIIVLIWFEPALHIYALRNNMTQTPGGMMPNPVWVLIVYTYFAFMLTWMREIVKDMEDFKGDAEQGCVTMPIKWGLQRSEWFTQVLGIAALLPLVNVSYKLLRYGNVLLGWYTIILLILPLAAWLLYLRKEATQQHYHKVSRLLKFIMVAGILSLAVYYLEAHA